jgi:hypothetical protein
MWPPGKHAAGEGAISFRLTAKIAFTLAATERNAKRPVHVLYRWWMNTPRRLSPCLISWTGSRTYQSLPLSRLGKLWWGNPLPRCLRADPR